MAAGAVLNAVGVTTSQVQAFLDAMSHNALELEPGNFVGPHSVVHGTLGNTVGGRQTDLTKPPRVSVFLGPQATLRGIVDDLVRRTVVAGHGPRDPYDQLLAAQGLYVYNRAYLESVPGPAWRVGLWLPLPVEVNSAGTWTVNWDTIITLGATFDPTRWSALDTPAAGLALPDPDALPGDVTRLLAGKDLAATADALVGQIVPNPFECVFSVVEVFRQLPATGDRSQSAVAIGVTSRLTDRELALLARVTAGNAILRRLWVAIPASAAGAKPARDKLATALGLGGAPDAWEDPGQTGPTVVPLELPLRPATPAAPPVKPARQMPVGLAAEDPLGVQALVMGRSLCLGNTAAHVQANRSSWSGPAYTGRVAVTPWARAHAAALRLTSAQEQARLDVVLKIAANEALLDGSRAADKGTLSSGIQQWSIHLNDELPALLERFRVAAPDHYDLFFGTYGLQVRRWARATPGPGGLEAPPTPAEADVRRDNPNAYTGTVPKTDPKAYDVGYATVGSLAPGGPWTLLPQPPDRVNALGLRHTFFGAGPHPSGRGYQISNAWCARVRLAALCSNDYRLCQIWAAVYRFERLRVQVGTITVDGVGYPAPELLTSQFAVAAALDQHINAPFFVKKALDRAAARTMSAVASPAGADDMRPHDPPTTGTPHPPLQAPWLLAFGVDYLAERDLVGKDHRDAALLELHDQGLTAVPPAGLSTRPGSFRGW